MKQQFLENFQFILEHFRWQDSFDILLVWVVVYRVLLLIRKTGTVQMLSGMGLLAIAYMGSIYFDLFTFNWLLDKFFSHLFLIVVILFQAEIRRALAQIGSSPLFSGVSTVHETHVIEEIAKGIMSISQRRYGALIVIERDISIDYHIESGTEIDAKVSSELLQAIFHPQSPIHDGATIIRHGKISAAGCFLPLSKNPALDRNLGTRHRAAIGLTEETDSLVFVVSEENQSVGIVSSGQLKTNVDLAEVRQSLYDIFGLKYKGVS